MSTTVHCPDCGAPLPADAPQGECPRCLLRAGFESEPAVKSPPVTATRTSSGQGHFVPPSVAELQPRIPQYEILELIGQGGMGAVYKAKQAGLGRLVAIKILPVEVSQSAAFTERFAREARALALLSHPHIVAVHDFGQAAEICYFVMEYVDGVNLRQALQAGKMSPQQALAIVPQICDALQYAHEEGVVHRDIKPENILIDKRGRVKIADFGLAKLLGAGGVEQHLTGTQQVMGTLRYMAPEQMFGSREVDHRADIFSLGVVFYELLTGELPVGRFAPPSKKSGVDARLDEVVLRALESEPSERYQTVSEMKHGLDSISQQQLPATSVAEAPRPSVALPAAIGTSPGFAGSHWHLLVAALLSLVTLWFVVYTAGPVITMVDGPDISLLKLGHSWGIGGDVSTIMSALVVLFAGLAAATAFAWWTYRAATVPLHPAPLPTLAASGPQLSRAAICGAILSPLFIIGIGLTALASVPVYVVQHVDGAPPPVGIPIGFRAVFALVGLVCLVSPFATTLLGVIAIGNIRRSAGKTYGMPLAVFDALLYPLLLLDAFLLLVGFLTMSLVGAALLELFRKEGNNITLAWFPVILANFLFVVPLIVLLDIWLIRRTWRAATNGLASDVALGKRAGLPLKEPPPFQPAESQNTTTGLVVAAIALTVLFVPMLLICGLAGLLYTARLDTSTATQTPAEMSHDHADYGHGDATTPMLRPEEPAH